MGGAGLVRRFLGRRMVGPVPRCRAEIGGLSVLTLGAFPGLVSEEGEILHGHSVTVAIAPCIWCVATRALRGRSVTRSPDSTMNVLEVILPATALNASAVPQPSATVTTCRCIHACVRAVM